MPKPKHKRPSYRSRDEYAGLLIAMRDRCDRAGLVFVEEMKIIVEVWLTENDPSYEPEPSEE